MVRNFGIEKRILFLPTRCDQYSIGPFEVMRTDSATMIMGMKNTIVAQEANRMSKQRLEFMFASIEHQENSLIGRVGILKV
jgi:hypothetical protein